MFKGYNTIDPGKEYNRQWTLFLNDQHILGIDLYVMLVARVVALYKRCSLIKSMIITMSVW